MMNLLDCLYIAINRIKKEYESDSNNADFYSIKIDDEVHCISTFNINKEGIEKNKSACRSDGILYKYACEYLSLVYE